MVLGLFFLMVHACIPPSPVVANHTLYGVDTLMRVNDTGEISMYISRFSSYQLTVQIETSVTVMAEGPHCDLKNWKHGYSRMHDISDSVADDSSFELPIFSLREQQIFPKISAQELQDAVRKHCGDVWYEHMKKVESPHTYPCTVAISRYVIKLEGVLHSGEHRIFIFYIDEAMGC
jgi:hypothetical protein